ncbi:mucoidy inhibitor MuiA family protein [Algoriphagus sp. AGSA1]|uniref:mucoidy inhibitor MuiA family protein n=1 Tax=Algoriphagus sp. AGSA1 TaxID=2907213 RepID=UPI001F2E88B8|nr:mucoidy inhibitor MuiA family protein [Algoriphagus sp. AGSA1]MCE7055047.1 mucoidy inhibitor MuiA family protein [Algoriphagus sp. AGSA1]
MKKHFFLLAFTFLPVLGFCQEIKESTFKSEIQEVTVFLSGAQIFETASGQLPAGESYIVVKGLSPYVDEKSIQVKGSGKFIIQGVGKRLDYLSEQRFTEKVKALQDSVLVIQGNKDKERARLDVLKEKASLLNANKNIGGSQNGSSLTELKQAMDFYDAELMKIKSEELNIQANLQKEEEDISKLLNQISAMQLSSNEATSEIRIRVKSEAAGNADLEINYLVANAGWYPKYDVRVENVSSPLSLTYKAEVYQNTGVDWKDVKLRFSNGNPNQGGQIPELQKWELNFARLTTFNPRTQSFGSVSGRIISANDGSPIPGASIAVNGTSLGTVSDSEGMYSLTLPSGASRLTVSFIGYQSRDVLINSSNLNISLQEDAQALEEVVVGYGAQEKKTMTGTTVRIRGANSLDAAPAPALQTSVVENQTTVEIEVAEPYSIRSNGEKNLVDLKNYQVDASYRYSVVPKLDNDAFLIAEIADWSKYSLLEGESNLYFEDGFVGRSILNGSSLQDTLEISMGRDRSIVIQREKNDAYSKRRAIGSTITESREYKIIVKNNKSQAVTIDVADQLPVSVNSDISVQALALSGGDLDTQTGKVTWSIMLPPGAQQELKLQYEVKYPKREKVILD